MTEIDHADAWAQDLDGAFRELGAPRDGDEQLLERMSRSAEAASPAAATTSASSTLALVGVVAGALVCALVMLRPDASPRASTAPAVTPAARTDARTSEPEAEPPATPSVVPPSSEVEPEPEAPAPAAEPARQAQPAPAKPSTPRSPVRKKRVESAAELLTRANAERKQGRYDEALALYARLQQQFPSTREAATSHMAMGRLYLGRVGKPAQAVRAFEAYLEHNPKGSLAPEAAAGIARAYRKQGDTEREREAWEQLLARFPNSVYLEEATRALGP